MEATNVTLFHYCASNKDAPTETNQKHIEKLKARAKESNYSLDVKEIENKKSLLDSLAECSSDIIGFAAHGSIQSLSIRSSNEKINKTRPILLKDLVRPLQGKPNLKLCFFFSCEVGRVPLSDINYLVSAYPDIVFVAFGTTIRPSRERDSLIFQIIEIAVLSTSQEQLRENIQPILNSPTKDVREVNRDLYFFNLRENREDYFQTTIVKFLVANPDHPKYKKIERIFRLHLLISNRKENVRNFALLIEKGLVNDEVIENCYDELHLDEIVEFFMSLYNTVKDSPDCRETEFQKRGYVDHMKMIFQYSCEGEDSRFGNAILALIHMFLTSTSDETKNLVATSLLCAFDPSNGSNITRFFILPFDPETEIATCNAQIHSFGMNADWHRIMDKSVMINYDRKETEFVTSGINQKLKQATPHAFPPDVVSHLESYNFFPLKLPFSSFPVIHALRYLEFDVLVIQPLFVINES